MDRLDESRQGLAAEAFPRAQRVADRWARLYPQYADEIESSAIWGVTKAALSYKPDEGAVWNRWCNLKVYKEIQQLLGDSFLRPQSSEDEQDCLELIPDEVDEIAEIESGEYLENLLGLLPDQYREICNLIYREGLSPYSAGQSLGITGDHGCRLHRAALAYLREKIAA